MPLIVCRRHFGPSEPLLAHQLRRLAMIVETGSRKLASEWHRLIAREMEPSQKIVVGVDEVGNGAIVGPICVAAVSVFTGWHLPGITDSKLIKSEKRRGVLAGEIRHNTVWTMGTMPASAINLYGAGPSLDALQEGVIEAHVARIRAVYKNNPIEVIVDGAGQSRHCDKYTLVRIPKADATQYEVSCASIIAKVCVDDWMNAAAKSDPILARYKIDKCKGYGTAEHKAALIEHGLSEHHRRDACQTLITGKRK
jgi:ribonuclease HII